MKKMKMNRYSSLVFLVLLLVAIEAPLGYFLRIFDWTSYAREDLAAPNVLVGTLKILPASSVIIQVDLDTQVSLAWIVLLPRERGPCGAASDVELLTFCPPFSFLQTEKPGVIPIQFVLHESIAELECRISGASRRCATIESRGGAWTFFAAKPDDSLRVNRVELMFTTIRGGDFAWLAAAASESQRSVSLKGSVNASWYILVDLVLVVVVFIFVLRARPTLSRANLIGAMKKAAF